MRYNLDETILFPFPPSVNTLYFQGPKHGQKFLSKKGKEYKKMLQAMYSDDDRVPYDGPVAVEIELGVPDKRARDLDNHFKALLDGLVDLNYIKDDSQVVHINGRFAPKHAVLNKGYAIIRVVSTSEIYLFANLFYKG